MNSGTPNENSKLNSKLNSNSETNPSGLHPKSMIMTESVLHSKVSFPTLNTAVAADAIYHAQDESVEEHDGFVKSVGFSLVLHLIIIFGFTIKAAFFEDNPVMQASIQVDIVDLPDKSSGKNSPTPVPENSKMTEPEPEKQSTATTLPPVVKTKPNEADAINLQSKKINEAKLDKEKQLQALNKLKQLNAIDNLKSDHNNKSTSDNNLAQLKKGNIISAGSAGMTGVGQLMSDSYKALVDQHFRSRWALPQYLRNKNLEAVVLVRFDEKGLIIFKEIISSSGNSVFDELVLATVEKSSPVPIPPERIAKESSLKGYTFKFRE